MSGWPAMRRALLIRTCALMVGVLPAWSLLQILPRLIGMGRAKQMLLTGNFVGARQVLAWDLVNDVVAPTELVPTALCLTSDLLSAPADMLRAYKKEAGRRRGALGSERRAGTGVRALRTVGRVTLVDRSDAAPQAVIKRGREQTSR